MIVPPGDRVDRASAPGCVVRLDGGRVLVPGLLPVDAWPAAFRGADVVRGVWVGECIETGRRFRHKAHAHLGGACDGWVCYLSGHWIGVPELAVHELAHLVSREAQHNERWRHWCLELGGTLQAVAIRGRPVIRSYAPRGPG